MTNITKPPSARLLGAISLVLWCVSLALPALSVGPNGVHFGLEILVIGWLSPLIFNFAWYANVFYLFGVFKLLLGGVPWVSVVLAALLSLDTIRLADVPHNAGDTPVYGYGWGAVLWFVAIFMLLAAAELRRHEVSKGKGSPEKTWEPIRLIGLRLAAGMLIGVGILAIHDHLVANADEARYLTPLIAFKRTAVCSAPNPVAKEPLRNFSGILEVLSLDNKFDSVSHDPFGQVNKLLAWGIPVVRVGTSDFYLTSGPKPEIWSKAATGQPSAVLTHGRKSRSAITARLVDAATGRVIFDQTWKRDRNYIYYYCPGYSSFSGPEDQPRRLLMQALGLSEVTRGKPSELEYELFPKVLGAIIERKDGGKTLKMMVAEKYPGLSPDNEGSAYRSHELININCPADVGWDMRAYESQTDIGRPFKMAGIAHYLRPHIGPSAFCDAKAAYIYQGDGGNRNGTYYLTIEKRSIPDFRQIWAGSVAIPMATRKRVDLILHGIESTSNGVILELVNDDTGEILLVKAPLVDRAGQ